MKKLIIIGAGGHGAVVADAAEASGKWSTIQFVDEKLAGTLVLDYPVLSGFSDLAKESLRGVETVVAIGDNARRLSLLQSLVGEGSRVATVVHTAAHVSSSAKIGDGSVVFAGAVVNARAAIGSGAILNTNCSVDHDCVLGDGVHISPGANLAGGVSVGERSWIGIGAAVREGISIGRNVIVGAGAAVVNDIPDGATVGGVPARILRGADDE